VAYDKALGQYAGFIVRLADGEPVANFSSHWQIATYQAIAASADGKWIGALDVPNEERAGYLLNSTNVEIKLKLIDADYPSGPLSIGIAPDNNTVAVGYAPYNLGLWDAAQRKELRLVKAHSNWVTTLGFSPDSQRLISGGGDSTARIWEVATGKEIGRIRFEGASTYVNSVGFSADGQLVFGAAENDVLIVAKAPK
jgi:WD40 repeat protein